MAYEVEMTDTFCGEANYGWVRREKIAAPKKFEDRRNYQRAVIRRAKAAVGMSGVRGVTHSTGDGYEFRPYGLCRVIFVSWCD